MPISIALYRNRFETVPAAQHAAATWSELVTNLGEHRGYLEKNSVPMFGPHAVQPGRAVGLKSVMAVGFGVLDLDKGWTEERLINLLGEIHGKVPYVFASSWSHQGVLALKGRLLLPFSRAVLPSEWSRFWPLLNRKYAQSNADDKCKDLSHRYYVPSFLEGGAVRPLYVRSDAGSPIDVDALLLEAPVMSGGSTTPTEWDLRRYAEKLLEQVTAGGTGEKKRALASQILAVAEGRPFTETVGERDNELYKIARAIFSRWQDLEPDQAAKLFSTSLLLMSAMGSGGPDVDKAADIFRRLKRDRVNTRALQIAEAFGSDRTEPYTPEELQDFADKLGTTVEKLQRRWVIQNDTSFYLLVNGSYRHYTIKSVASAAKRDLSPAISAQVDTNVVTERGVRSKTPAELVDAYGTVATGTVVDFCASHAHFDEQRALFVEAPCQIRVEAKEHPEIARWLELLAGPQRHQRLLQWIAAVTMLEHACAALYLEGSKGAGKSLLAHGLARVFSADRVTDPHEAFGGFNEQFASCPLVFADETCPTDVDTSKLRQFVQARTRPLTRKFRPNATIRGCARLILAANNRDLIKIAEHLTQNDIEAIVERFFYLPVWKPYGSSVPPVCKYLSEVGPVRTKEWIETDMIAQHALFLRETVEVPLTARFLVSGEASELTRSLATSTGIREAVCNWLVGFLLEPAMVGTRSDINHCVRVCPLGRLLVNPKIVVDLWDAYVKSERLVPSPMKVAQALKGLSVGRASSRYKTGSGQTAGSVHTIPFFVIDWENLCEWASSTGYATRDRMNNALQNLASSRSNAVHSEYAVVDVFEGGGDHPVHLEDESEPHEEEDTFGPADAQTVARLMLEDRDDLRSLMRD